VTSPSSSSSAESLAESPESSEAADPDRAGGFVHFALPHASITWIGFKGSAASCPRYRLHSQPGYTELPQPCLYNSK